MADILMNSYKIETEKRETHLGPYLDVTRVWYIKSDNCKDIRDVIEEEFKKEFTEKDVYKYLSVELNNDDITYVYFSVKLNYADVPRAKREMFVGKESKMMRRISERLKAL